MIGFYDYTVLLTYLSLISAVSGMALAMTGHPILATIALLLCGLCDMFVRPIVTAHSFLGGAAGAIKEGKSVLANSLPLL